MKLKAMLASLFVAAAVSIFLFLYLINRTGLTAKNIQPTANPVVTKEIEKPKNQEDSLLNFIESYKVEVAENEAEDKLVQAWESSSAVIEADDNAAEKAVYDENKFHFSPAADERNFIDVWRLKKELKDLEEFRYEESPDFCYPGESDESEGEGIATTSESSNVPAIDIETCVQTANQKNNIRKAVLGAFNRAWLPLMKAAIKAGDPIAEVILRNCDTTFAFDRTHIASTCTKIYSEDVKAKTVTTQNIENFAERRLFKIGFYAGFDRRGLEKKLFAMNACESSSERQELRRLMIQQYLHGVVLDIPHLLELTESSYAAIIFMNSRTRHNCIGKDTSVDDNELIMNALLVDLRVSLPSVYIYQWDPVNVSPNDILSLHRNSIGLPEYTAGPTASNPRLSNGNQNYFFFYAYFWRSAYNVYPEFSFFNEKVKKLRSQLLSKANENINAYIKADPRWSVFLLERISHHEFVPRGMESKSFDIPEELVGKWELVQSLNVTEENRNFHIVEENDPISDTNTSNNRDDPGHSLLIRKDSIQNTIIEYVAKEENLLVAAKEKVVMVNKECKLIKSGEKPTNLFFFRSADGQSGNYWHIYNEFSSKTRALFKTLTNEELKSQYVLWCKGEEELESDKVHFIMNTSAVLVEVSASGLYGGKLTYNFYKRPTQ